MGLRGFSVLLSFLWTFMITFVPGAVKDSAQDTSPLYQTVLKKTLSVLFWNGSLIYSLFIILSARSLCIPFLENSSRNVAASLIFRRGLYLWVPVAVGFGIAAGALQSLGLTYIDDFKASINNTSIETPYSISSPLIYWNSLFELFWVNKNYGNQAGNNGFPSQTLWIVNLIFQQSYTVFMAMIPIPYTRTSWRVNGWALFILSAWWVQSWAWYSITGLAIADVVTNMDFKSKAKRGIALPFKKWRLPTWVLYACLMLAGIIMQYVWTAAKPEDTNAELKAHTGLYNSGSLNQGVDPTQPMARDDNYLFLLGLLLWIETSDVLQWILSNPLCTYLGRRSLSKYHYSLPCKPSITNQSIYRLASHARHNHLHRRHQALHAPALHPGRVHGDLNTRMPGRLLTSHGPVGRGFPSRSRSS